MEDLRKVMEEVGFEGDLHEFFEFVNTDPQFFFDEPDRAALQATYQPVVLLQQLWIFVAVLLVVEAEKWLARRGLIYAGNGV